MFNAFVPVERKTNLIDNLKSFLSNNPRISVQSFLAGDFIRSRTISDYVEVVKFIKDYAKSMNVYYDETREINLMELVFIFPKLVGNKRQLQNILTFNSDWLEASSITSQFSIHLTNSISKNLIDKYTNLDKCLELLINPKGLRFTEDELLARFNYPSINLNDIDLDFI